MKRYIIFTVLLLLSSLTASFAQASASVKDTSICYGLTELREIAAGLKDGEACKELLDNANEKLKVESEARVLSDSIISIQKTEISLLKKAVADKNEENKNIDLKLKKSEKKVKRNRAGWLITAVATIASGITLYFIK